ncbi:MAG: DinB family protein [Gemmatimonadota bacterium]|nr:DinB family protein [Gemmatimonadota bacterium]
MSCPGIAANRSCLEQALDLLDRLDDDQYARRRGDWAPVGAQYRHVVEHYLCLLEGVPDRRIDYDARRRDVTLEVSRQHAIEVTRDLHGRLAVLDGLPEAEPLEVQTRTVTDRAEPEWAGSTLGREIQFLVSHTIHHFALIRLLLAPDGLQLPAEFGVAPSTLAHADVRG